MNKQTPLVSWDLHTETLASGKVTIEGPGFLCRFFLVVERNNEVAIVTGISPNVATFDALALNHATGLWTALDVAEASRPSEFGGSFGSIEEGVQAIEAWIAIHAEQLRADHTVDYGAVYQMSA